MMPTGNPPAGTVERPHPGTGGLTLDIAFERGDWPDPEALERLAEKAVMATLAATGANLPDEAELSVLFTDDLTMRALNARWRDKDRPTNVLSFPQDGGSLLGDIVLAFQTVRQEAALAHRPVEHHIAHLLIHGFLHIPGIQPRRRRGGRRHGNAGAHRIGGHRELPIRAGPARFRMTPENTLTDA